MSAAPPEPPSAEAQSPAVGPQLSTGRIFSRRTIAAAAGTAILALVLGTRYLGSEGAVRFDLKPVTAEADLERFRTWAERLRETAAWYPAAAAQEIANQLVDHGISGILNFSPSMLSVPDTVMVKNVNLAIELENLSYFVQQ